MVFSCLCSYHSSQKPLFFCFYQQNKYSESKVKFRQASNRCKGFLKLPNLYMLIKQKSLSLPRNLVLRTFGKFPIVFLAKVNLLYLLCLTVWKCCLLHLIKQDCLLKTLVRTLIFMTQVSLYLFSLLELI